MSGYHGDIRLGDTIHFKFTTVSTTGAPTTLAGTPVMSAYPGSSTTQLTAGITLTVDFDTVTGLHDVTVVASGANGYATATNYSLVITTGTVGGTSVVGYEIGSFSIENRSAVMPTTAGRTIDVSAGGEAGVDWANVGTPSNATNLSATTVNLTNTVTTYTGNTVQTGDSFARIGLAGAGLTNIDLPNQTMNITGDITGNLSGSVGSVTGSVGSVTGAVGSVTGAVGSVTGLTASDVGAIKTKTDSLTFTVANQIDANAESMNATTILGTGAAGDLWRG